MPKILFSGLFTLMAVAASASENSRGLDAHEHGVGILNIAIENGQVAMELEAPGADIVGFEYQAATPQDRRKVDDAIAILAKPMDLFRLPDKAACQVRESNVELHGGEETDGAHERQEQGGHTEYHATYTLICANPDRIRQIEFLYFQSFPNAQELEVQLITEVGATGFEVKRDRPIINLSDMI